MSRLDRLQGERSAAGALWIGAGLAIWLVQLGAVYAWTAVGCARGLARSAALGVPAIAVGTGVATLLAAGACGAVLGRALRRLRGRDRSARFIDALTACSAAFSLIAIAWTALPALVMPSCP